MRLKSKPGGNENEVPKQLPCFIGEKNAGMEFG